jgi:hypothetical protein
MLDDPMMGPLIEQLMGSMLGGGGGSGGEAPAIDPAMLEQLRQLQP